MVEKVETEEGSVMMVRAGTESEVTKRGKAVGIETGTGEEIEIETGTMLIEIEIMGVIGIVVDIDIKNRRNSACTLMCWLPCFVGRFQLL